MGKSRLATKGAGADGLMREPLRELELLVVVGLAA